MSWSSISRPRKCWASKSPQRSSPARDRKGKIWKRAMTGRQVVLNSDVIEQPRTGLGGGHLLRGEGGYEAARKIYNAMIAPRPAIIARCAGAADVIAAVNFARN